MDAFTHDLTFSLIDRIAALVEQGLSIREAAKRCGIHPNVVTTWMTRGRRHVAAGKPTIQASLLRRLEAARAYAAANPCAISSGLALTGQPTERQTATFQAIKAAWQAKGADNE